jgi:hypothetical protein
MKLPLAVIVIGFVALLQGRADPEIHLIPAGYAGEVTIVFRAANGEPILNEGGARLYQVPANGILLTQAAPNVGLSPAWKFFFVAKDGERLPIPRIWASPVRDTPQNRADPAVEIFYGRHGRLQAGSLPCDVEFDQYFVGTTAQVLSRTPANDSRRLSEFLGKNFVCR